MHSDAVFGRHRNLAPRARWEWTVQGLSSWWWTTNTFYINAVRFHLYNWGSTAKIAKPTAKRAKFHYHLDPSELKIPLDLWSELHDRNLIKPDYNPFVFTLNRFGKRVGKLMTLKVLMCKALGSVYTQCDYNTENLMHDKVFCFQYEII